jgi:hypothetical protein
MGEECCRIMTIRQASVLVVALGMVLVGASPAQAVPEEAIAAGSVGSVDATYSGASVDVDPLAECETDGLSAGSTAGYRLPGFVEFGSGSSTCSLDDDGVAHAEVSGTLFRLDVLRPHGGPRIRMTGFSAECSTTENGSTASFHIGGLSGISVPPTLPPNHVVTIPGSGPGAPPLAKITLNETITPEPPDGSMTVNIMHIHLFPDGGPHSGELTVGTVECAPF